MAEPELAYTQNRRSQSQAIEEKLVKIRCALLMINDYKGMFKKNLGILLLLLIFMILALGVMQPSVHNKYGSGNVVMFTMMGGKHFAETGFIENKLTPMTPAKSGRLFKHTHFPPLPYYIGGVLWKLGGQSLLAFRLLYIFICALFIAGVYAVFAKLINPIFGLFVTGALVMQKLLYSLSATDPFTTAEAFTIWAVFLLVLAIEQKGPKRTCLLAGSWTLIFLNVYTSFEFIVSVQLIVTVIIWMKVKENRLRLIFILTLAPLAANLLHFLNNAWVLGGIGNAYRDLAEVFLWRTVDFGRDTEYIQRIAGGIGKYPFYLLGRLKYHYNISLLHVAVLAVSLAVLTVKTRERSELATFGWVLPLFVIAVVSWWFMFLQHTTVHFNSTVGRHWLIAHSLIIGGGLYFLIQGAWNHRRKVLGYVLIAPVVVLSMVLFNNLGDTAYFLSKGYKLTWSRELNLLKKVNRQISAEGVLLVTNANINRAAYIQQPRDLFGLKEFDVRLIEDNPSLQSHIKSFGIGRQVYILVPKPDKAKGYEKHIVEEIHRNQKQYFPVAEMDSFILFKVRAHQ